MRVITGSARGIVLSASRAKDLRPTSQRVKEALFSAIQFLIPGANVLDLYAGSGQLGIEALSRGAATAVFVDNSDEAVKAIHNNLDRAQITCKPRVIKSDALVFLSRQEELYDIVFIDPPYGIDMASKTVAKIGNVVAPFGTVVCETERKAIMPKAPRGLTLHRQYTYGQTSVFIYRKRESEEPI